MYIILAFVIASGCGIISVLHERASAVPERNHRENYIVKPPAALKSVYMLLCFTGLLLFSFFLFLYLIGNKSVTIGHLRLFLIIAMIGLLVTGFASRSRLCVDGDRMELHRLFHLQRTIMISEIERVETEKKIRYVYTWAGRNSAQWIICQRTLQASAIHSNSQN